MFNLFNLFRRKTAMERVEEELSFHKQQVEDAYLRFAGRVSSIAKRAYRDGDMDEYLRLIKVYLDNDTRVGTVRNGIVQKDDDTWDVFVESSWVANAGSYREAWKKYDQLTVGEGKPSARTYESLHTSLLADLEVGKTCNQEAVAAIEGLEDDCHFLFAYIDQMFTVVGEVSREDNENLRALRRDHGIEHQDDSESELPEHLRWIGDGPAPARWTAADGTVVYRSYADYCWD